MYKIIIKQAKVGDLARIVNITKLAYKQPYKSGAMVTVSYEPTDLKEKFLKKEFFILVAMVDEKIVGAVRYRFENGNLYLYKLAVMKSWRRQGIAGLLINKLEKISKQKKCPQMLLDTAQEKLLVDYYKKYGFHIDKIKKHQDHHDVYMSKKL